MRNFEKFKTAQELAKAYCRSKMETSFLDGDFCEKFKQFIEWIDLEAEEEKPLPCPFCGGEMTKCVGYLGRHALSCTNSKCHYVSKSCDSEQEAISAHNRVEKKHCSDLLNKVQHAIEQFERTHDGNVSIVTETDTDNDSLVIRIFGGKK